MSKISALTAITSVQADDVLPVVDVHDTTQAATGTTKKMPLSSLDARYDAAGAATAAQAASVPRAPVLRGAWQPGTSYALGDLAVNPAGVLASATSAHTSGTVYTPANWSNIVPWGGSPLGVYKPQGWGANSKPLLSAAAGGTGKWRVAVVGDSIGRGYFSSNLDTKGWAGLLGIYLRGAYGNGGTGFKGCVDTIPWMTNAGISAGARTFYTTAGNVMTTAGSWAAYTATNGPGGQGITAGSATDTITYTGTGTTLKVYALASSGQFTVQIDGGIVQTVTPSGTGIYVASFTGLTAGSHTAVLTSTGWVTGTTAVVIFGFDAENATGTVVHNFSMYGQKSGAYANGDSPNFGGSWNGGFSNPADLAIFALSANDADTGVTPDTWTASVQGWISGVIDTFNGNSALTGSTAAATTDLVLVLSNQGHFDPSKLWGQYLARARSLAEGYGMLLIDMSTVGRNSWQYWNNLGYWANAASPGTAGTDSIHPSDAGHQFYYQTIASVIAAALTAP